MSIKSYEEGVNDMREHAYQLIRKYIETTDDDNLGWSLYDQECVARFAWELLNDKSREAAPELLEACEGMARVAALNDRSSQEEKALDRIRKAIRKAKGESE